MEDNYFSERELGPKPRIEEEITSPAWGGICAIIIGCIRDGSFGIDFPEECPDGNAVIGTDDHLFSLALQGEIPEITWPFTNYEVPRTLAILDLIEFCHSHIAKPNQGSFHSFFNHHHLSFNRHDGQFEFRQRINRIFSRNSLAFELNESGQIKRLISPVLFKEFKSCMFKTGDSTLDFMLETACLKFLDPDPSICRESLEKLWDAWERIKTLEPGKNKKASIQTIIERASAEVNFRQLIDDEGRQLTDIGNRFHIRHSETSQIPIREDYHIDWLFHRMFALIQMILRVLQ